jgi:pimeloyl-ACP methyl ester carboxylesterase
VRLAGRVRATTDPPRAAVVVVHGFTATADHPEVGALADELHAGGFDVLTYDARGHGGSDGECTLGDLERYDVAAAVTYAKERTDDVVLVGASMGAIAVLRYAADHRDLAGVVAVSCPARWELPRNARSIFATGLTRTPPGRALASRLLRVRIASRWLNPAPPIELVPRIGVPVAFVHGTGDRFIPASASRELHAAAPRPRRLELVAGMGHAFDATGMPAITEAVEWVLASRAPGVETL